MTCILLVVVLADQLPWQLPATLADSDQGFYAQEPGVRPIDPQQEEPPSAPTLPRRRSSPEDRSLPLLTLDAEGWDVHASGWIFITRGSEPGSATKARLDREFDLETHPTVALGLIFRPYESQGLGLRAMVFDQTGTWRSDQDFIFHGTLYPAGREIRARIDVRMADLDYQLSFRPSPELRVTGHLGVEYWQFFSRIRTVDGGPLIDQQRGFDSGLWFAGIDVSWDFSDFLAVRGSAIGGVEGSGRSLLDLQIAMEVKVLKDVSLTLGYRLHELRFHQSTNQADLLYSGPILGLELRF